MEHNFFTTQSRLCRAEAEHRALSLKSLKICKSSKRFAKASTNKIVGSFCINRGVVHKLRWQDFGVFMTTYPLCVDNFYGMDVDKKWTFLDHLPTSSCKHSLWTTPNREPISDPHSAFDEGVHKNKWTNKIVMQLHKRSESIAYSLLLLQCKTRAQPCTPPGLKVFKVS